MKAYSKNEQVIHPNNEQVVTEEAKVPYEPPEVTVMGKVEHLTALLQNGTPDLLSHGNIL